ncbi:PARP10_14_15 [Mytilus coruscus]|uniref:PARP10_14_15 n=1 Tax=Mytilus coruscus TaxID=42192 RepID=A0A6J8CH69_MYTCO|nr:PARP10_14_15 [Mytilus coruscus]
MVENNTICMVYQLIGLNKEKLDRLLPKTSEKKLKIGDVKVAAEVINTLETSGFRSLGISLNYNKSPEWKMFSFTLLSCLWSSRSKLKCPVVVYCFGEEEEFDSLDHYLWEELMIDKCLLPIKAEPLQYEEEEKSIKVLVEQGSILDYDTKVDILINSVGASLDLSNGIVSEKLVKIAGKSVQDECYKKYKNGINIGDIAITSPGNMKCKRIFHVALYRYWVFDGNISAEILKNIMIKCLKGAEDRKMTSIAFPALGTGTLGYPPCLVAKTMFAAVKEYEKTNPTYLKQVYFVLFGGNDVFQLFKNIDKWKKDKVKKSIEYDIPPKQLVYIPRDLETRVTVTDMEYFSSLKYKDLKAVITESGSLDMKMDWNGQDGCFVVEIKMGRSEDGMKACFADLITHMQKNKYHMADLFLQKASGL